MTNTQKTPPTSPAADIDLAKLQTAIMGFQKGLAAAAVSLSARASFGFAYQGLTDRARDAINVLPDEVVRKVRDAAATLTGLTEETLEAREEITEEMTTTSANATV